jgi:hypothetical protein
MHKISFNQVTKEAPANWSELTREQLISWVKICAKNIAPDKALMFVSHLFYGLTKTMYFQLNAAQQIQLADCFKYLLNNQLFTWLIPSIKVELFKGSVLGRNYQGPADLLSTSTIEEFKASESFYHAYLQRKDERFLDQLIACLYRPNSKTHNNGKDERKTFSEVDVNRNAGKMRRLDKHLRAAILFNYEGCRSFVVSRYPTVFIAGDGTASNKLPDLGPLIKTVAGGKFGSYKETEQMNLYTFLDHLKDEIEESNRKK